MTAPTLALTRPHPRAAHGRLVPLVTLRSSPCPDSATSITVTNGVPQVGQHLDHPAFVSGMRASTSPVTCIDFTCHESGRAAAGFTTRSNTSGDPTPCGFCADPDIVERRRRPVARRGCGCGEGQDKLRCPVLRKVQMSARVASPFHRRDPRPLLLCLRRQHRFFHFDAVQTGKS